MWDAGSSRETSQAILYLRKQNEVLSTELQLAEQTASRLRSEATIAKRAADQASAQLISQMQQSRQSQRTESDHRASMAQQEQINLLRESNQALRYALPPMMSMESAGKCYPVFAAEALSPCPSIDGALTKIDCICRADHERAKNLAERQRQRADQAERAAEPLRHSIRQLNAGVEAKAEEIRVVSSADDPLSAVQGLAYLVISVWRQLRVCLLIVGNTECTAVGEAGAAAAAEVWQGGSGRASARAGGAAQCTG